MASPKMSLKLLVDNNDQTVLFAEATKGFIDFLFHIFSLPLGTLIEFLGSNQMVGCLGELKDRFEIFFDETDLEPGVRKDEIFNPRTPYIGHRFLLSNATSVDQRVELKAIYMCSTSASKHSSSIKRGRGKYKDNNKSCKQNATLYAGSQCPSCRCPVDVMMTSVIPDEKPAANVEKEVSGSYVKDHVTYIVMDNLFVRPMSSLSSLSIISSFEVKDLSQLEERMVTFGKDEALKLLKASLSNEKVLTTLFLHNKHA